LRAGEIDGTAIGGNSASTATFTDLTASGTVSFSGATVSNGGTVTTIDINGGTIDGVTIGGASAGAGSFTTLTASGDVNFDSGTLFVDASASAVGIGTSSPAYVLDVLGSARLKTGVTGTPVIVSTGGDSQGTLRFGSASTEYSINGGADYLAMIFNTNGSEAMRIDSSGNVKIADGDLEFTAAQSNYTISVPDAAADIFNTGDRGNITIQASSSTSGSQAMSGGRVLINAGNSHNGQTGDIVLSTGSNLLNAADNGFIRFNIGGTASGDEAMRLDASGNLLVGKTAITAAGALISGGQVQGTVTNAANATFQSWSQATSGDNLFVDFYTEGGSGTQRGSIDYNRTGGLVRYNTTSDYRAKDIIGPVQNTGATIDALKVYEGKMKGATQSRPMLVAHEAQEHTPYAVSGVKDEMNEDGTPKFQQIDVSSLVPLLIAEIQSLRARVAQLEGA